MHPIICTSGHLPDNFIWWHFRTVVWLGYVKVALLVKHVNVVLPQSSCWCSSIINWGLMNRGKKNLYVASVVLTYSLNCLRCESPYRAHNSLWRLHLQLICSLSLFHAFSCFDNLVSYRPLVWCILVFDWISKRYDFEMLLSQVSNWSTGWICRRTDFALYVQYTKNPRSTPSHMLRIQ